jgi:haloalkane dehalogenase
MWEFPKSVLSFSWAMSLFGVQQMANLFAPSKATKAFEDVTQTTEAELGSLFKAAFKAGDTLQRGLVDLTFGAFTGQLLDPRRGRGTASDVAQQSANPTEQTRQRASGGGWSSPAQSLQTAPNVARPSPHLVSQGGQGATAHSQRAGAGWGPMPVSGPSPSSTPGVQSIAEPDISPDFPYEPHYVQVLGSKMHYIIEGSGDPILLLHGNPEWSYVWRNIIPHLSSLGRCIAPDLIGYGRSAKPNIEYRWFDHVRYLEGFIDTMGLRSMTLVLHDQGSGLGFHYAMRHEHNVKGIVFLEAIVRPYPWDKFSTPEFREIFRRFRSGGIGGEGWQLIVEQNMFIEQLLPQATGRPLTETEMNFYREPFRDPASRVPIWRFPRETPIGGEPKDVWDAVTAYSERLQRSELPKLMLYATPGALLTQEHVEWCQQNIKNLTSVHIGPGLHFLQESSPHRIGREIAAWYRSPPESQRS